VHFAAAALRKQGRVGDGGGGDDDSKADRRVVGEGAGADVTADGVTADGVKADGVTADDVTVDGVTTDGVTLPCAIGRIHPWVGAGSCSVGLNRYQK
jgi:hypothetical protein